MSGETPSRKPSFEEYAVSPEGGAVRKLAGDLSDLYFSQLMNKEKGRANPPEEPADLVSGGSTTGLDALLALYDEPSSIRADEATALARLDELEDSLKRGTMPKQSFGEIGADHPSKTWAEFRERVARNHDLAGNSRSALMSLADYLQSRIALHTTTVTDIRDLASKRTLPTITEDPLTAFLFIDLYAHEHKGAQELLHEHLTRIVTNIGILWKTLASWILVMILIRF